MQKDRMLHSLYNNKIIQNLVPWGVFLGALMYRWRVRDFFHTVPAYGDALEILWGIQWYAQQWLHFRSAAVYPLLFYPAGFRVATLAHTPATFAMLLPLYLIGGEAFALNIAVLLCLFLSFGGMYRLARKFTGAWSIAILPALLFTFWDFHWLRVVGHLHVMIGSALLPWLILALDRAWDAPHNANKRFVVAGVLWAVSIMNLYYFVWIDGVVVALWLLARICRGRKDWSRLIRGLLITGVTAVLLSAPVMIIFLKARSDAGMAFYTVEGAIFWGASVNSLPVPPVFHPYLGDVTRWLYRGPFDESGTASLGMVIFIAATIGLLSTWRDRKWRPVYVLAAAGLVIGMGMVLRWNGDVVRCDLCQPLNQAIWWVGHALKPDFFATEAPVAPLDRAIPLPGLVLGAVVPFWEGARVFSRYVFIAAIGLCLLAAEGIRNLKVRWLQVVLVALLLFESIPLFVADSVPVSPESHAAFEWIKQNTMPGDVLVDMVMLNEDLLVMPIAGEIVWATLYHERATVAGVGSYLPAPAEFLYDWLVQHPHAFQSPDLVPMLRLYQADYILLHMKNQYAYTTLEEAGNNHEVELVDCFDPPSTPTPWTYPICVLKILPSEDFQFDVLRASGWSTLESWGVWAEGMSSKALWMAADQTDMLFSVDAFPYCVPDESQNISIQVDGVVLATHQWDACDPWSTQIVIPVDLVKLGMNEVTFEYAYAARPSDVTEGENPDMRSLSVGFTKLQLVPSSP